MKKFYKKIKGQGGAVLLVVLAVSAIVLPLIQGVWMDSQVEYRFSRYRMNELQARYNAKSGIALSLLRIDVFKGLEKSLSGQWASLIRPVLDTAWSFSFMWPFPLPEEFLESEKEEIKNITNQSFLKGTYVTSILPEDGFLDINDLSSPLISLRNFTYDALLNLFINAMEKRPELQDKYDRKDFERILNNLSDWTDLDNESQNGGSEELIEEGRKPLNRSFVSIEEIKKVPGVNLEIFEILSPHITVYGAKALNINYSSMEVLRALNIPEPLAEQILFRTTQSSAYYNPFLAQKDFCDFMNQLDFPFCEGLKDSYDTLDILSFGHPMAFRIKSSGEHRKKFVHMEALLYDLSSVALHYQKSRYYQIQREKREKTGESPVQEQEPDKPRKTKPKQLKFDYSYNKSLIIMYMKESS